MHCIFAEIEGGLRRDYGSSMVRLRLALCDIRLVFLQDYLLARGDRLWYVS